MQLYISAIIHLCKFCIYELLYFSKTLVAILPDGESRESLFLVGFLGVKALSGSLGRVTPAVGLEGEKPLPLAVLRQSLSGVQRGHSGTQGLA